MFKKTIVIDGKNHMVGRLATYVAKELLSGQKIVVVRCEGLIKSGSLFRNKFLRKCSTSNPRKLFVHYRAPSRILWRTIRGMVPHKTARGAIALGKLKVFDGVPSPYDVQKRVVIQDALKITRLKNHREFCKLGDLSTKVGWSKQNLIDKLEEKRKDRAKEFYKRKVEKLNLQRKADNLPELKTIKEKLAMFGY